MDDTGTWRNHAKVFEGGLTPAKKFVAFFVSLKFDFEIVFQSKPTGKFIHLNTVVDDEVARNQWVDFGGIASHTNHGATQCSKVDNSRNSCEVLQYDSTRFKRDFNFTNVFCIPIGQVGDVVCVDDKTIDVAKAGFQ